jgi:hypothetical protein
MTDNPHPNPLIPAKPPTRPRPPRLLLPEWGEGLTPEDREHAAVINERYWPADAIRMRCIAAGYPVEQDPANAA